MSTATLKDIAIEVGLSVNTVSRVLNGKNKEVWGKTAARAAQIRRAAQRLNYIPNAAGRAMQAKGTGHVGVLLVNDAARRTYYMDAYEFILGMDDGLAKHGFVTAVVRVADVNKAGSESRVFRERVLDGIIAVGNHSTDLPSRLNEFGLPVVWLDTNIWQPAGCIRLDDAAAGQAAAGALVKGGWKKIVFLTMKTGPKPHHSEIDRAAVVEKVAREHGMPFKRISLFDSDDKADAPAPPMPAELEDELRSAAPGELGIISYNTLHANRLVHSATAMGYIPGVHYGLACCDDNHELSQTWPALSRMHVDRIGMGEMAAEMLLQSLRNPKYPAPSRTVAGRWIDGTTSGPPSTPPPARN